MPPDTLIIAGAGDRGMNAYAPYALSHPDKAKVVGVAEPRDIVRARAQEKYGIADNRCYKCWREVARQPKFADAVLVCMQDQMHAEPAIAFMDMGYHVLLEKPMAVTEADCRAITAAAKRNKVVFAVCHVLRYTQYTRLLVSLLRQGAVGDIVSVRHLEPVGWWHQAHSFVRGNWGNTARSTFMLMAKSCHDMDLLRYIIDKRCLRVSSFGTLKHFRRACAPKGASDRCVTCPADVESPCPYSALKLYPHGNPKHWPISVITTDHTPEGVMKALQEGPYGRCAYACDNDVVDHQVVAFEFEGGVSASFTMTAFTRGRGRETHIMGTRGELVGDSRHIKVLDFLTKKETVHDAEKVSDGSILSGHGGGDGGVIEAFISAVASGDTSAITTGPDISLESHLIAFAAERARVNGTVEAVQL